MRIGNPRTRGLDKVTFDMTPMIDCCFQLIIFFMLSLRLFSPEGDFSIKMPLAAPSPGTPDPSQLPPLKVRLTAGAGGSLAQIRLNDRNLGRDFGALRKAVIDYLGGPDPSAAEDAEAELDCDYNLRYEYVIEAITAVAGYVSPDGQRIPLIENIKFAPPRPPE